MTQASMEIGLLGQLEVTLGGERIEAELRGVQGKLCFAYLALNRERSVPRAELEDALWPGKPPSDPGAALSTLLSRLRRTLGEDMIDGRSELRLVIPGDSAVDVERAQVELAEAERLVRDDPGRGRAAAERAIGLLDGELLAGFEAPWLEQLRRELEETRLRALEIAAIAALELGDLPGAERTARRLIRSVPYRESGHMTLMQALARQGNTAEALRAYEDLRVILRDELGTAPSRDLAELHRRVVSGEELSPSSGIASAPSQEPMLPPSLRAARASGPPFVGRRAEIEELSRHFAERGPGASRLALVHGDPGIGKTRLCAELGMALAHDGVEVLYGRCEDPALAQLQPFVEALGAWAAAAPESELRMATDRLPDAARLVPQIRRRLPDLPEPTGETDRLLVFDDVAELLARATRARPMLIVLDDLHWADEATLLLLKRLVRAPQPIDCLMVGTYRITEYASPLTDAIADLRRDGFVPELALGGLAEAEIAELVLAVGGGSAQALVRDVARRSEGNPFFVSELLREISSQENGAPASKALPSGANAMVERRLRPFEAEELDLLSLAAVIGRDFTYELLEAASQADPADLARLLDRASAARVAQEVPGTVGHYSFDHALIQDFLLGRIGGPHRAQLHLRVANALETISESNPEPYISQIAHHYAAATPAGAGEQALEWATIAGWHAQANHAHEDAAGHYREALRLLGPHSAPGLRTDLQLLLGESLVRSAAIDEGRAALLEAADGARSIADGERFAYALLSYGDSGGAWSMNTGESDTSFTALLEEGLERIGESDPGIRARLCGRLAGELLWSPDSTRRVEELGQEAIRLARGTDDAELLYRVLIDRAVSIWTPRTLPLRRELTREALELARTLDDRSAVANAAMWHGLALAEDSREPAGWRIPQELSDEFVQEARNSQLLWVNAQLDVNRAIAEGRLADAGEAIGRMLSLAPPSSEDPEAAAAYCAFVIARERHLLDGIEPLIDEQLQTLDRAPQLSVLRVVIGLGLAGLGRVDEARAQLAKLGDDFSAMQLDGTWSLGFAHAAELIAELGDRSRAATLYEIALEEGAQDVCALGGGVGALGACERYLGLLAMTMGDHAEAADHFERAIEINDRKEGPLEAAHARVDLAAALLATGPSKSGQGRIDDLVTRALEFAGHRGDLERLRRRAETIRSTEPAA